MILVFSWWLIFWLNTATHEHGEGACVWDNKADAELMANTASEHGPTIYRVRECKPSKKILRRAAERGK